MNSPLTRTIITTAAAAAVGVTVGALSLGPSASAHSDQQPRRHTTTMRFAAHDGQFAMDDLGDPSPHGPGMGDVVVLTQRLTQHGKTVGKVRDAAVGVDGRKHLFQANGTLTLEHGTITGSGLVTQTSHFVLAVTGGTGKYLGARGKIAFDFPGGKQLLTVTLLK